MEEYIVDTTENSSSHCRKGCDPWDQECVPEGDCWPYGGGDCHPYDCRPNGH